jgi:hypothetical protein
MPRYQVLSDSDVGHCLTKGFVAVGVRLRLTLRADDTMRVCLN